MPPHDRTDIDVYTHTHTRTHPHTSTSTSTNIDLDIDADADADTSPRHALDTITTVRFTVNDAAHTFTGAPETPLLWVLRDHLGLTGPKFGCGVGGCTACTVLERGRTVRSCQIPVGGAGGRSFTTIEGLSPDGSRPCAAPPTDADIDDALSTLICRCGTYQRMRQAIHAAALLAKAAR